ncbi:MAG: hypothetical protein Q4B73_09790 [Lachnospiraceae bacterium]|nr:hypothetical protein [Lachnospiraceae bacterium]
MKKRVWAALLAAGMAVFSMGGCGSAVPSDENGAADTSDEALEAAVEDMLADAALETDGLSEIEAHLIGVVTYDVADAEVVAFRQYLESYITECFPGVKFLYTDAVISAEEEAASLEHLADAGVDGIMSFITYNLDEAVNYCADKGIYYMMASGTVAEEEMAKVADNSYFVGVIGPGNEMEYEAGRRMAAHFIEHEAGDSYFVLSGGGYYGNEMHLLRTMGILDELQAHYDVTFEQSSRDIATSGDPVTLKAGNLSVTVCPGFMTLADHYQLAETCLLDSGSPVAMAVMAAGDMPKLCAKEDILFGMIDFFTEDNQRYFVKGGLDYLAGKYGSMIGPSFAAMYNAVTGYADEFRQGGKAFSLTQNFWEAASVDEYLEKYALASGLYVNAYNYEDLYAVCKVYNPSATMADFEKLTTASSFEEASARRALNQK